MSNPLEDIYFDFKHFINSALEDASLNANKLSSLHEWVHTPTSWQVLKQLITANVLEDILSHVTGVFQILGNLLMKIGMRALLVLIAILVGVPLWLLSASLSSFFASNPIIAVASCAALGVGFFVTIRALSKERDILLAFRDKVEDLWPAYESYKFANRDEYRAEMGTPDGIEREMVINNLHTRAKSGFLDILLTVIANRADKIAGFENISQVRLREYLRQAIIEL